MGRGEGVGSVPSRFPQCMVGVQAPGPTAGHSTHTSTRVKWVPRPAAPHSPPDPNPHNLLPPSSLLIIKHLLIDWVPAAVLLPVLLSSALHPLESRVLPQPQADACAAAHPLLFSSPQLLHSCLHSTPAWRRP